MSEIRKWLETIGLGQYADAFARIVNQKYKLGSDRRALALFWLASMPKETIEAWGNG
jgi:hypothetical protein